MALKGDLFAQSQLMPLDAFRITHLPEQGRDFGLEDDAVVLDAERGVIGHVLPVGLRSTSGERAEQPDVVGLRGQLFLLRVLKQTMKKSQ